MNYGYQRQKPYTGRRLISRMGKGARKDSVRLRTVREASQPSGNSGFGRVHFYAFKAHSNGSLKDMVSIGSLENTIIFLYGCFNIFHTPAVQHRFIFLFYGDEFSVRCILRFRAAVFQFDDKNILNAPNRKVYAACVREVFLLCIAAASSALSRRFERIVHRSLDLILVL